jgi:hypothetical protein
MMNRLLLAAISVLAGSYAAAGAEISSAYTDIDTQKTCSAFSINEEGGEFANFVCNGWNGYPVLIYSGDLRESLFYGFPPEGDLPWESFSAFNSAGTRIEWRIETDGSRSVPFATIHRWSVSADPEKPEERTEVLVVAKVAGVDERSGCTVGLVLATGNPGANEAARKIADEQAKDFRCGVDKRILSGDPLPHFSGSGE